MSTEILIVDDNADIRLILDELIKDSGCQGFAVGDAYISEKHCNFFVNKGKARSQDLENLIHEVKNKVFNKTGVSLELELQIIGEK